MTDGRFDLLLLLLLLAFVGPWTLNLDICRKKKNRNGGEKNDDEINAECIDNFKDLKR